METPDYSPRNLISCTGHVNEMLRICINHPDMCTGRRSNFFSADLAEETFNFYCSKLDDIRQDTKELRTKYSTLKEKYLAMRVI